MADSEEFLRESEEKASEDGFYYASDARELEYNQINSYVKTKNRKFKLKNGSGRIKSYGATAVLTILLIIVCVAIFGSGSILPSLMSERLVEETDVQYADAVQSKMIVFQEAMREGDVPEDTAQILKEKNVLVGYMENGQFIEANKSEGELSLLIINGKNQTAQVITTYGATVGAAETTSVNGEIVTADEFVRKANSDLVLYNAFNEATYSRAAYYFDASAEEVFKEIGTTRDNYTADSELDEVVDGLIGEGSDIKVNTVSLVEKTRQNADGETEVYYDYEENGAAVKSGKNAEEFVQEVGSKNSAGSTAEATLYSADALKVADTIAKEQRSSLFYLVFMENVSKMKVGLGNDAKLNEAMNYLYKSEESEIVDVKTGEIIKTTGSPMESPSLYAVLSGNKMKAELADNYSSDRILKTVENQLGVNDSSMIRSTVGSSDGEVKGAVGRYIESGLAGADQDVLSVITPTVASSLVDNSYRTIKGVNAGEFLVEGAINVGNALARKSGASSGDAEAVLAYNKLTSEVLAMDAKVDRMNRSPFDITSRNTFLGSIFYKVAVASLRFAGSFSGIKVLSSMLTSSINLLVAPNTKADEAEGYLSVFGDCETYGTIGAVGSAQCAKIGTFDVTTLNDPYNNAEYNAFVEENTTLGTNGARTINKGSVLEDYIKYNNEQETPLGVTAGDTLTSANASILDMIIAFLTSTEEDTRMASGAAFVNSANNPDWQTYKYAQRFVSLSRAKSVLKQFSKDKNAYNNLKYLEGETDPVMAYLESHKQTANR